jgi:hypothetical protein
MRQSTSSAMANVLGLDVTESVDKVGLPKTQWGSVSSTLHHHQPHIHSTRRIGQNQKYLPIRNHNPQAAHVSRMDSLAATVNDRVSILPCAPKGKLIPLASKCSASPRQREHSSMNDTRRRADEVTFML